MSLRVSNAERIVYPEVARTKGDVVAYYERIAKRLLPHLVGRPLTIRRFPKGLSEKGFFQKNVPAHYPAEMRRVEVPRTEAASKLHRDVRNAAQDVTVYPLIDQLEQLPYLANQGAIELHVPTARVPQLRQPDRLIFDLDPPAGALAEVRRAAYLTRDFLADFGLQVVPVATGSKGYHLVASLDATVDVDELSTTAHKLATLLANAHPNELTTAFRIRERKGKVFLDWLRNTHAAHGIAPYSLRATPNATAAAPIAWDELEHIEPAAFTIADVDTLLARPDPLLASAEAATDARSLVAQVEAAFERSGLVLEAFDRFRS